MFWWVCNHHISVEFQGIIGLCLLSQGREVHSGNPFLILMQTPKEFDNIISTDKDVGIT
jgi:hypothetical protein